MDQLGWGHVQGPPSSLGLYEVHSCHMYVSDYKFDNLMCCPLYTMYIKENDIQLPFINMKFKISDRSIRFFFCLGK